MGDYDPNRSYEIINQLFFIISKETLCLYCIIEFHPKDAEFKLISVVHEIIPESVHILTHIPR